MSNRMDKLEEHPICNDSRKCCFRNILGRCDILRSTYLNDGDCNFAKKNRDDKYSYNHAARRSAR